MYNFFKLGIGEKMYNILKDQMRNTNSSFKYNNLNSSFFNIDKGVIQGDSLNPTLFNIFINDINNFFENKENCPLKLVETYIGSL